MSCIKKPDWLNFLKGVYDTKSPDLHILVTGSARLDVFYHAGDSLAGRFFRHRLLPFNPLELSLTETDYSLPHLLGSSGFPEPFLSQNETQINRWRLQYTDSMLREDLFEIWKITQFNKLKMLYQMLLERVGSTVSFASLARDLNVSGHTVKNYIEQLEALYVIFRVTPHSRNIARSILKEPKIYFFDTGAVANEAARLENLAALTLLQYCYLKEDLYGVRSGLHYLRDKEGHEVDFAVTKGDEVDFVVEVKTSESKIDKNLKYFQEKYRFEAYQIVQHLQTERSVEGIDVRQLDSFLNHDLKKKL